jgi:hypothetical protein
LRRKKFPRKLLGKTNVFQAAGGFRFRIGVQQASKVHACLFNTTHVHKEKSVILVVEGENSSARVGTYCTPHYCTSLSLFSLWTLQMTALPSSVRCAVRGCPQAQAQSQRHLRPQSATQVPPETNRASLLHSKTACNSSHRAACISMNGMYEHEARPLRCAK